MRKSSRIVSRILLVTTVTMLVCSFSSIHSETISRIEGHCSAGVTAPSTTWYLPEGSSAWGFECWLLIQNPNSSEATCTVTYMIEGSGPQTFIKKVPASSRSTFNMADDIGSKDASIKVEADIPVIPERAMYRNNRREGHDSIGTTTPATYYYLAEGSTIAGFSTYVLVQNPNPTETSVTITYMATDGPKYQPPVTIAANSRKTIKANDVLPNADFSIRVHGSQPIIAERSMYWNGNLGEACHDSIGITTPSNTWYLAEGSTNGGFETWVLIQNPNDNATVVQLTYMTPSGPKSRPPLQIAPNSRQSVNVADSVPNEWSVSTRVDASNPVIAERSVYWNNRNGGHNSIGVTSASVTWYLAEGSTNGGFETWVLIQNPNDTPATANITYMTPAGERQGPPVHLESNTRQSLNVADKVPDEWSVSTKVTANIPVIAERSMYWSKKLPPPNFTSDDYPTTPGLTNAYVDGDYTVDSIPVGGPWEFKSVMAKNYGSVSYVNPAANYAYGGFPDSNVARVLSGSEGEASQFFSKSSSSMYYLGNAEREIVGYRTLKFNPPILEYRFPFNVGDSWESSSTYSITGLTPGQGTVTSQVRVIGNNSLKLTVLITETTYNNCYLMEQQETDTMPDGTIHSYSTYYWLVPGIGRVAYGSGWGNGSDFVLQSLRVQE